MFQIEITSDVDSLLKDSSTWDSLTRGVPFRDSAWLGPWWQNLGVHDSGYILLARDDFGQIRGILPLYRHRHSRVGRRLSMLGDGPTCSDYVSVLASEQDAITVASQFGNYLIQVASDPKWGWDVIEIDGVVEGDEPMIALSCALKAGDAPTHAQSRMSTWSRSVSKSWDEHLATHGKSQRRKIRTLAKLLADDSSLVQSSAQSPAEIDRLLDALISLHQRRWTAAGEQGSFRDLRFQQFIRDTALQFYQRGDLYLTALERDGKIIGVELNIIGANRVLYSYSSGFDLDHSDVEPGRVLGIDTLQHLYRSGLAGIDYMRGDEEYKQRFAAESRRVLQFRAVAPAWYPKLRHAMWNTQFELKQLVRRKTGRAPIEVLNLTQGIATPISTIK